MINCQSCGAVNSKDSISCVACNRTLLVVCPQCAARNPYSAAVCNQCGRILQEKNDPKIMQQKFGDPVDEMFSSHSTLESDEFPRNAFIKVVSGGFIFSFLYMSQILSGHPIILLLAGLISGIVALWGLIDITFWIIADQDINKPPVNEQIPESFPTSEEDGLPIIGESFEDLELQMENSIAAEEASKDIVGDKELEMLTSDTDKNEDSSQIAETESSQQTEEISESDESEKPQKALTLAEFLSEGIEKEISSIKKKIKRSPENYALIMRLAQLHEERGELDLALETMEECIAFQPEVAEIYLYHGILLRKNGKLDEAKEAFEQSLGLNKFMSKAFYQLGSLERSQKSYKEARDYFQRCIQLSPDDAYAHYQLGMIYREIGDLGLAQMELKRATILHPTDSYGHSKLGQVYQTTGQLELAISEYSLALSLKPGDSLVLEKLAEVVALKGMFDKAAELFQEAISHQFHPQIETMLKLAKMLQKLSDHENLNALTDEILRLEPENSEALFLKAMAAIEQNHKIDAVEILEKLGQSPQASYEVWLELGKLYQENGDSSKAISAFIRSTTNAPDQAGIWNTIGILLGNQKAYEEALKAFKKAISFDYTDSQIQENYKSVQKKLEQSCSRIVETRKKALNKDPEDLPSYLEMGRAFELLQRPDDAMMAYQRLLAIDPEYIPGLLNYAELLRKKGRLKMAMRCYKEVLKLQPENCDTHIYLVQANLNMGFLNEALRHAVIAQKIAKEDPRVHFLLGKIYFAKGLAPRALKEFTIVAETSNDPDMISWAELMRRRLSRKI